MGNRLQVILQVVKTALLALFTLAAFPAHAQKTQFSGDMELLNASGETQTVKLYVGNQRARIERTAADAEGIGTVLLDFDHQLIYLLIPRSKFYLWVTGSQGSPFYNAAWMFRPQNPASPCDGWVHEADRHGINLNCEAAGDDNVDGRPTQRWNATATNGASGSLWYDPDLQFVVKIQRKSPKGIHSGYTLKSVKKGMQPPVLFETTGYREFTMPKLLDVLTGAGQW